MPFKLSSARSLKSSIIKSNLSDMESGRFNMSGIMNDGHKMKSSSKSRKSPNRYNGKHQQQQQQQQQQHQQHQQQQQQQQLQYEEIQFQNEDYNRQQQQQQQQHYHQNSKQTPPRSKAPTGPSPRSNRSRSNNRYPPHQYQQMVQNQQDGMRQQQQHPSMHDHMSIPHSHSNQSHGSRQSTHSKQSNTSAAGQNRHHHQHNRTNSNNSSSGHTRSSPNSNNRFHHQQHKRVPSVNSEVSSVHSFPTITSRSTSSSSKSGYLSNSSPNSDPRRMHSNHQYGTAEHRDPHGETTNTRRKNTNFNSPPRHNHHSSANQNFPTYGNAPLFPSSPMIKQTPMKSSGASVCSYHSYHSRGSMSQTNGISNGGKSSAAMVVSNDKQAIKATKKVIEELKKSESTSYLADKRIIALTNACAEFDHLDYSRHNMELQQGAAAVLCKVFALILDQADSATNSVDNSTITSSEENDSYDDALRMIATALEMVFRGQATYVHSAYNKCGTNEINEHSAIEPSPTGLLPLLLRLLDRAEGLRTNHRMKKHNADITLVNTTKVLLYLSRVPELRVHLAKQTALLDVLGRVANKDVFNGVADANSSNTEARVARLRIIANLVNKEENKSLILTHRISEGKDQSNKTDGTKDGELLSAILRIAHLDPNERAREYAGVALMDLASAPANQIPMTRNEQLLGTLVKMILLEKNPGTRESAITALQNLAFTKENRIRLVSFKNGVILEALIRALSNTNKDYNEKSRRRSAGALTNLACDESAGLMGRHKGLLQTLAIVGTKDESPEVQTRAAMALTKLASSITVRMDASKELDSESQEQEINQEKADGASDSTNIYTALLDALVVASLSSVSNSVSAVLRVKARDPENRYLMAKHPGILDTLVDMCLYDNDGRMTRAGKNVHENTDVDGGKSSYAIDIIKDRDNATRALMHLTNESKNRTIMCTPSVLNALVRGASITDEEIQREEQQKQLQDVRDSAVRAIERLATEFSNRYTMAHHNGMIVAIARATEREAKIEAGGAGSVVVIEDQAAISSGTGANTSLNESVEVSSYSTALTQMKGKGQTLPDPQHAHLAKPLLMSLLVAM